MRKSESFFRQQGLATRVINSSIVDFHQQLEDAEKSSRTLKETLEEVEGSVSDRGYQQSLEMMEAALRAKDREITSMKTAEKARVK